MRPFNKNAKTSWATPLLSLCFLIGVIFNTSSINVYANTSVDFSDSVDAQVFGAEIKINTSGSNYTLTSTTAGIVGTGNNPTLTLTSGADYTFTHEGSGHPFKVTVGSIEETISSGESKTISIPKTQTSSGSYVCTIHSSMTNTISFISRSSGMDSLESNLFTTML